MQDKPTSADLLEAIQDFLMKEVLPQFKDKELLSYKTLVSWNMLGSFPERYVREKRRSIRSWVASSNFSTRVPYFPPR